MKIPYYQIDAFANSVFTGNPAGVCLLEEWPDDFILLAIAAENNLSETAFLVKKGGLYDLRWFTPKIEVDLCGHATLASAFVVFNYVEPSLDSVGFTSKSGALTVAREGDRLAMDFPARKASSCPAPEELVAALGIEPIEVLRAHDCLAVFDSQWQVESIRPDFAKLEEFDCLGTIITAPGVASDFVSLLDPQDPHRTVRRRAHTTLIPYWAERLRKTNLYALQISERGGELFCEDLGDRVKISGKAVAYLEGTIIV
ncbi:PhzF family phenazine biosynthesis protein [Candidatus Hydrogenedentota bacterium]